jgi:hypothetical protein
LARKIQHQRLRWSRLNNTSANVLASKPGSRLLFRELIQDPYCIGNGRKHEDTDGNFLIGASGVARRSATIVPNNRLALPPSMTVRHDCSQQSFGTSAVHGGPPRLFPTIVWHFCRPWRSATIIPDNRLALPPSMAAGHDHSRQSFGTSAVHGGRPRSFPTIVWHFRRPWRSATIVPDNRLTLLPSMAVDYTRMLATRILLAASDRIPVLERSVCGTREVRRTMGISLGARSK